MNRVLISNPFLSPPSGDNDEEKALFRTRAEYLKNFILFSLKDFNQAWAAEEEVTGKKIESANLFPSPISSPTISTTSTELAPFDIDMDDELMSDIHNFNLDDCQLSPFFVADDLEKDSFSPKGSGLSNDATKDLLQTTTQAISLIDSTELTMFPATNLPNNFGKISTISEKSSLVEVANSMGSQLIDGESMWLDQENFNLFDITANDPVPNGLISTPLITVNPTDIHIYAHQNDDSQAIKVEPMISESIAISEGSSRPSRQRRKSVQTSRNVQDSPMTFQLQEEESVDLHVVTAKPDVKPFALAPLNGSGTRSRADSASSSVASPAPSKTRVSRNGDERKKRKYECDDVTDPSVKNAKAAKMNRDKKKQQLKHLETQVKQLTGENKELKEKLDEANRLASENDEEKNHQINFLTQLLESEKSKNAANSKQKVTMFDLMKNMVSVVQPQAAVIYLSERLGATPMPDLNEMDNIRAMQTVSQPNGVDTYLTVKVGIGGIPSITFDCENKPQH